MSEDILSSAEAAELLGITPRTLVNWRHTGKGPTYAKLSHRHVLYRRQDIDRWVESKLCGVSGVSGGAQK